MATVSVLYPKASGTRFDYDYYENTHLPLVGKRWANAGLVSGEALLGRSAADGSDAPYFAIGILHFESPAALTAAMTGEHAQEVIGDIANFTDVQPVIQINDRIAPGM
jgi:uncharacterized protein (TIGR02118 family)